MPRVIALVMAKELSTEPAEITAGDSCLWRKSFSDYPASAGWVLSYVLINQLARHAFNAVASGADFLTTLTASASAAFGPGEYKLIGYVDNGTERYTVTDRPVTVKPNPETIATLDPRSTVKKTLDAIEEMLLTAAPKAAGRVKIESGGVSKEIQYSSKKELTELRDYYRREYAREQRRERMKNGTGGGGKVLMRLE